MMDHRYNDPLVLPEIYRGLIKNIDLTSDSHDLDSFNERKPFPDPGPQPEPQ